MQSLAGLQRLLLTEITRAEPKIRKLKAERRGILKNRGKSAKKRSLQLQGRIEKVQFAAYIWRCFGDAIAFIYLDKHALKQTYFSTHSDSPRQTAGFFSGRKGLSQEIAFVEEAWKNQVPALLNDLTNSIRYGDISIMLGPDPQLVEIKSSARMDRRGRRQRDAIEKVQSFLNTDKAVILRDRGPIARVAHKTAEKTYLTEFNKAIAEAVTNGHAVSHPEKGLAFVVFTNAGGNRISQAFSAVDFRKPNYLDWNENKNQQSWAPYTPFILTILDAEHLWRFLRGEVYIVVVLDLDSLVMIAKRLGYRGALTTDVGGVALEIEMEGLDRPMVTSSGFLKRILYELCSPEWIVKTSIENVETFINKKEDQTGPLLNNA